jgi:hypothetical protein
MTYQYYNKDVRVVNGKKTVRVVSVKNGRGYKSVTKYRGKKRVGTVKKPIHDDHIHLIGGGKFIPGLFDDCICTKSKKTKKNKKL